MTIKVKERMMRKKGGKDDKIRKEEIRMIRQEIRGEG